MLDPYSSFAPNPSTLGRRGKAISASNSDFSAVAKAVVCAAAGNITLIPADNPEGEPVTFTDCPVGFIPPYQVRRVTALTGAWATVEG